MNDPMNLLLQLGAGAVFVVIILDRVFAFLKNREQLQQVKKRGENGSSGTSAGEQSPEYWRQANKALMTEVMDVAVLPILLRQTEILSRLEARTGQNFEMHMKQQFILEELSKSVEKLRAVSHTTFDAVQTLAASTLGRRVNDRTG